MRPTVSDRLRDRGSLVVGRDEELARAQRLVTGKSGQVALHVHGPGGVGKTAYLHEVERLGREAGRPTRWVDVGDLEPVPAALLLAFGTDDPAHLGDVLPERAVVLLDRFEAMAAAERWFWRELLPALPVDVLLAIGSRVPPAHLDERLADLVSVLALRNLPGEAAARLLHARGIPEDVDVGRLVADTYGHPLALVIAADAWAAGHRHAHGGDAATLRYHPDPAARLLGRFVDDVDDPLRREALHVAAHARRVDRVLLREALGVDSVLADELLGWLRARPYAEMHPDGLALHDVVRDALDHDLRWRDPDGYERLHASVREVVVRRLRHGEEAARVRAATDLLFLHRGNPATRDLYDYPALGRHGVRPVTPADRDLVLEVVARVEGTGRAGAAGRCLEIDPAGMRMLEDAAGALLGVVLLTRLDHPTIRAGDPVGTAAWELISRRRPPEPGEHVLLQLAVDADHPHRIATVTDLTAALSVVAWSQPHLGWVVLASRHPTVWAPTWAYVGFDELGVLSLDGDEVAVWGRDFGRSPFDEWLAEMRRRELDATGTMPGPVAAPVAFNREDFAGHVRELLRDLHRPERLAANPLVRSDLVRPDSGTTPAQQLLEAVVEAVALTEEDPPTRRAARAVDRTYLRPGTTQEAAAEVLGMPFSTYRRHLARGVGAVVERLWAWEVRGGRRVSSS